MQGLCNVGVSYLYAAALSFILLSNHVPRKGKRSCASPPLHSEGNSEYYGVTVASIKNWAPCIFKSYQWYLLLISRALGHGNTTILMLCNTMQRVINSNVTMYINPPSKSLLASHLPFAKPRPHVSQCLSARSSSLGFGWMSPFPLHARQHSLIMS